MTRYFDASALVKRYVREAGSSTVRRLLASGTPATSRLSEVEVASAIARRAREGAFAASRRDRMTAALDGDLPALAVVEMIPEITAEARALLVRHPLRAGDAIQLASCLYLQRELREAVPFVAFDQRLSDAARAEGLTIVGMPGPRREQSSRGRGFFDSATRRSPSPKFEEVSKRRTKTSDRCSTGFPRLRTPRSMVSSSRKP